MERCEQDNNHFMAKALLDHAKEICRYARTFCEPSLANQVIGEAHKRKFHRSVERMINEMHSLMLMASYKGISNLCNREQIDAYMEQAKDAIVRPGEVRQSTPQFN